VATLLCAAQVVSNRVSAADVGEQTLSDAELIDHLFRVWRDTKTEIGSAHLKLRRCLRSVAADKKIRREDFVALMAKVDLFNRPDDLRQLSDDLGLGLSNYPQPWGSAELYLHGGAAKEEQSYDGKIFSTVLRTDLGQRLYANWTHKQITVQAASANGETTMKISAFNDFLPFPLDRSLEPFSVIKRGAGLAHIRCPYARYEVDEVSGFIQRLTSGNLDIDGKETWFEHVATYPGGIRFPSLIIEARYIQGYLTLFGATIVEIAEFNDEQKEKIVLPAPKGTRIIDHRAKRQFPIECTVDVDTTDILKYLDEPGHSPKLALEDLLQRGDLAPNMELTRLSDGGAEKLGDYQGKVVVLEFWHTSCGACQEPISQMQEYPAKYPEWSDTVALLTVCAVDFGGERSVDEIKNHLQAHGWDKTHNVSINASAINAYHVDCWPTAYVIDQQGKVVAADRRLDVPKIVNSLLKER
jgi:peroxiredoxin